MIFIIIWIVLGFITGWFSLRNFTVRRWNIYNVRSYWNKRDAFYLAVCTALGLIVFILSVASGGLNPKSTEYWFIERKDYV